MKPGVVIEAKSVSHWFGTNRVLHDVNLEIGRGSVVALVGPSGCGKSTLLRALIGTHPPCAGAVWVRGADGPTTVITPGSDRGIVYQHYSLFPFFTATENAAIGPILLKTTLPFRLFSPFKLRALRRKHEAEAAELLTRLGLGHAVSKYPHELSGGMRQRVAIAQALIMKPKILFLDEPFGALDEATREDLQDLLLNLAQGNRRAVEAGTDPEHTILIVTHELNEAIYVGDRVVGLSQHWKWEGRHAAPPGATIVYDKPAPIFEPGDPRDFESFRDLREEIRRVVFEPDVLCDPGEHLAYRVGEDIALAPAEKPG